MSSTPIAYQHSSRYWSCACVRPIMLCRSTLLFENTNDRITVSIGLGRHLNDVGDKTSPPGLFFDRYLQSCNTSSILSSHAVTCISLLLCTDNNEVTDNKWRAAAAQTARCRIKIGYCQYRMFKAYCFRAYQRQWNGDKSFSEPEKSGNQITGQSQRTLVILCK